MRARFIREIGVRRALRRYWGEDCPNQYGRGGQGCHNAQLPLEDRLGVVAILAAEDPTPYPDARWPTRCDHCPATAPAEATRQVFALRLYDSPEGIPQPGDLFFLHAHDPDEPCHCRWTNCDGQHLHAILPTGRWWDIDSRCSNCTLPEDTTHRCWIRHGVPGRDPVHVDKAGTTCTAGAGSIEVPGWHGYLHHGEFHL